MTPKICHYSLPLLVIGLGITFSSCFDLRKRNIEPSEQIHAEAYVPVYGIDPAKHSIKPLPAKPTVNPGKIYVWGNWLFQVEQFAGIHVIDYSDKKNPVKLGFIEVKGCTEIAVKGTTLIANNMRDLVSIDVSQPSAVKEVGRIKMAFPHLSYFEDYRPAEKQKWFVCPDYTQGDVIGWKLEKNIKAYCYNQ